MAGISSLPTRVKNLIVMGGLTGFVFGTYFYTMHAISSIDEVQVAIDRIEDEKREKASKENNAMPSKA